MADLPTDTGFNRPEFSDVNQWIKQLFIQKCGSNIDTDDPTIAGIISGVMSKSDSTLIEYIQGAVNQMFLLSANTTGLDDIGAEWGLARKQATPSFVTLKVECYYDQGSPVNIPAGEAEFSTADAHQFVTLDDINITQQATDSNNKPLAAKDGSPLGVAYVQAQCLQSGLDTNVAPNTIVNPMETIDGFYSVTNPDSASGGTPQETDNLFRKRIYNFRSAGPAFTDNGITSKLRNLPDVEDTKLVDNNSMQTDKYGNPPKSIHLYVLGGDDKEIGQNYFNCLYPTTHTVGSITVPVISDDGITHQISFDHAQSVNVYIHLKLFIDTSKFNSDNGVDDIKNRIINTYFDQLKMGQNVLYSRLFGPSYAETGVNYVEAQLGTDKNNLASKDIPVKDFELGVTDFDHIQVDLDGDNNVPSES